MTTLTIVPAFGRDYKTKAQALNDWNDNKDFVVADMFSRWDGKPVNKSSADREGTKVMIRYNNLTKITKT